MNLEQQQVLEDVHAKVSAIAADVGLLRQELLGSVTGDTSHGRLPRVEAAVDGLRKRHGRRIGKLEKRDIRWTASLTTGFAIGSVVSGTVVFAIEVWLKLHGRN